MTLQAMRKKANLSQSELAAVSDVKLRAIQTYEIEQRNINHAKLETLCKLALALDCTLYDLLTDEQLKIKLKMTV
jgi:transcriptional regulator with XRE-family HTH domain